MTTPSEPDYETVRLALAAKNRADLQKSPHDTAVRAKILAHLERHGLSATVADIDAVCARLPGDPLLASFLCKDPSKQTYHQKTAAAHLKATFPDLRILPARGPQALYVSGGKVVSETSRSGHGGGKSIDFVWTHQGRTVYALHKHTKDEGGAQDNQARDALEFVLQARDSLDARALFLALCDGPYYERMQSGQTPAIARHAYLNSVGNGRNVFCATTGQAIHALMAGNI